MSAEEWLRAAKTEEQRLLSEIMKTDLYKQLEAVRGVLAVYPNAAAATPTHLVTATISAGPSLPASERALKAEAARSRAAVA